MSNILFMNRKTAAIGTVKKIGSNIIQILGDMAVNTSGFHLVTDGGAVFGKYEDFTTLYREINGGFQLSNDGSVYVNPEPEPEPEPYVPTLEEIQEEKVTEMNVAQQNMIQNGGFEIALADGIVEHFDLTDHDQISLNALDSKVKEGIEQIPWHTSDDTEHCKFYSNADMKNIVEGAFNYIAYQITYFRDLRIYIRSLTDVAVIETVTYGMYIPEEYQSEPLKAMLAAMA